jgi:hypothetical protein
VLEEVVFTTAFTLQVILNSFLEFIMPRRIRVFKPTNSIIQWVKRLSLQEPTNVSKCKTYKIN